MSEKTYTERNVSPDHRDILVVGCGKMAGALLSQWITTENTFTALDPSAGGVPKGVRHVGSAEELAADETFDVIVVGLKPQLVEDILPGFNGRLKDGGYVFSMAAGMSASRISGTLGGARTVRIMPNLPAAIGSGISALYAGEGVSSEHRTHAESLALTSGKVQWVDDEDAIDRFTAIAGSGPGYVFELLRAYTEAATGLGFSREEARKMVLATVIGTARMAEEDERSLTDLRNAVTSPNGTTAAGLDALAGAGSADAMFESALKTAYARAVELR
ncbi:MAG: pyrroline-5-carboxylate reductase dimerization domain-containing protein [Parvularcula sp.]|jgi:pyrroline-5-carboxylate reductase|nr:pyrroline-5-carboxylate reductase dimerization domain-containing protein [Parvularcula sp.]